MQQFFALLPLLLLGLVLCATSGQAAFRPEKTSDLTPETPEPVRFVVRDNKLLDLHSPGKAVFFKGMGYSPFLVGETPLKGANPGDDGRYDRHLPMMLDLGVNYLHIFPRHMPPGFFKALDKTELVYGQDIWLTPYDPDYLDPAYQARELEIIKKIIDHTYAVGRPDKLVLFSIGDELRPESIVHTNTAHPERTEFRGKHLVALNRTPTEVAVAQLMDAAMDYELTHYGKRHLYCHTSFSHVGPVTDRPDLELPSEHAILPDLGDLICLNLYTYANAVRSSGPGRSTKTPYQGYLEQLAWETHKPILIGQTGYSTSPIEPNPKVPGFGGHKEAEVAAGLEATWRDLKTAQGAEHFCGMAIFEWQDEWWKSGETWDDESHHAPEDPEEWFGVYAMEKDGSLTPKGPIPAAVKRMYRGSKNED